jgi:hypothetical protein
LDWIQVAQDNLQRQTTMNIPSYSHWRGYWFSSVRTVSAGIVP